MFGGAKLVTIICTAQTEAARKFYTETLGLKLLSEDVFALVFQLNPGELRVAKVAAVTPAPTAVAAFEVPNIGAAVGALQSAGVVIERYAFIPQDERGVWKAPDGTQVAWFRDPDLNLLSVIQPA